MKPFFFWVFTIFLLTSLLVNAQLQFNEILYYVSVPVETPPPIVPLPLGLEFIELYNAAAAPVDFSGWTLTDATTTYNITIIGTNTTLASQEYLLIISNDSIIPVPSQGKAARTNTHFELDDGGESLSLRNPAGALVDSVNYGSPFQQTPLDKSLELFNPLLNRSLSTSWAAALSGSTPNAQNSVYNAQPMANAGPDRTVTVGTLAVLNGTLSSDPENGTLVYTWSGANATELNMTNGPIVQFIPNTTGLRVFTLTVSDGVTSSSDNVTVTVNNPSAPTNTTVPNVLVIQSVKAKPSSVNPGDTITVEVRLKNNANFDLENVELFVEIRDKDNDIVEDDNGNELEDDSEFTLDAGDDENDLDEDDYTFTFNAPFDFEDGDKLTIHAFIQGVRTDNASQRFEDTDDSEFVRIKKKDHDIVFTSKNLNPSSISCNRESTLSLELRNVGDRDEDVALTAYNDALGFRKHVSFEMDNDPDDDTNEVRQSFSLFVNDNQKSGIYTFTVDAVYDDGGKKATSTLDLLVQNCLGETTSTIVPDNTQGESGVVLSTYTSGGLTQQVRKSAQDMSFTDSQIAGIVLGTLFIGLFIFVVGAVFLLSRRTR